MVVLGHTCLTASAVLCPIGLFYVAEIAVPLLGNLDVAVEEIRVIAPRVVE